MVMDVQERLLYLQAHPLKIGIDVISLIAALYLLWANHLNIIAAVIVLFAPSFLATIVVMRIGNLQAIKDSALGHYLRSYLTRAVEWARSAGVGVMVVGAWFHLPLVILAGALIIAGALMSGIFFPNTEQ